MCYSLDRNESQKKMLTTCACFENWYVEWIFIGNRVSINGYDTWMRFSSYWQCQVLLELGPTHRVCRNVWSLPCEKWLRRHISGNNRRTKLKNWPSLQLTWSYLPVGDICCKYQWFCASVCASVLSSSESGNYSTMHVKNLSRNHLERIFKL